MPEPSGRLNSEQSSLTGRLILRIEDLDRDRCKPQYQKDLLEDLYWCGFRWQEGPDIGGDCAPYHQSDRLPTYLDIWKQLNQTRTIYPSPHSRKDVAQALSAPHEGDREVIFPTHLRPKDWDTATKPGNVNWRFQVPDGETIAFQDQNLRFAIFHSRQRLWRLHRLAKRWLS